MDWYIVVVVVVAGIALITWALRAGRSHGAGLSEADKYQRHLAQLAQKHNQEQVARALALKPAHPAGRTGYSASGAFRTSPAQGQNETHGQNLAGTHQQPMRMASGQGSQQQAGQQLNPALLAQLRQLRANGQQVAAIKLLRQQTGLGLLEAKQTTDRL